MATSATHIDNYFDAVIIGAGISGMYQLHLLRKLGLSVKVFETGSDVGGTWYWNRYPGCRFDSESYSYCYSFSQELLTEWNWTEHFSPQPETLKYLQFVAEKFDLRKDIQFNTRIKSAKYSDHKDRWVISTAQGEAIESKFLITAIGALSAPYVPDFQGKEDFQGNSWHTSLWPKEPVDLSEKRVGVIGTGATAVQLITEISKNIGELYVFQLKPEYCVPLRNEKIDDKTQKDIKQRYPEIFARCKETFGSFLHGFDDRSAFDVSAEEREKFYEELWNQPGFGLWLGNFHDILTNQKANDTLSDFVKRKIKEQVNDPVTAEKICPKDHGFGTRRVPLESGYYKSYNRNNVSLIDISESPIEKITSTGIKTKDHAYDLDLIIYATGFDAVTGAFNKIEITGENGLKLNDKWSNGPSTYLGLQTVGFPNFFTLLGPHNGSTFCNIPRCIEQNAEWVTECIKYMSDNGYQKISAEQEAENEWTQHVYDVAEPSLLFKTDSWFSGSNIPGKKRAFLMYAGGSPTFREKCEHVASNGYEGFQLSK